MKAHHIIPNARQLTLFTKKVKDVSSIPVISELLEDLCPSLLDGSSRSAEVLKDIVTFIDDKNISRYEKLERVIPAELFTALCGVKNMLRNNNLNSIALGLDFNKQRFGEWLKVKTKER